MGGPEVMIFIHNVYLRLNFINDSDIQYNFRQINRI